MAVYWKQPCRAATTQNITLSGTQTIDGVALNVGDRVLVKDQPSVPTDQRPNNGIYNVQSGAWTRASDAATSADVVSMIAVAISQGTLNARSIWLLVTADPITLGTTPLTFAGALNQVVTSDTTRALVQGTGDRVQMQVISPAGSIVDIMEWRVVGAHPAGDVVADITSGGTTPNPGILESPGITFLQSLGGGNGLVSEVANGSLSIKAGGASNGNIVLQPLAIAGAAIYYINGEGGATVLTMQVDGIHLSNPSTPSSNPASGGILYQDAGAGKWRSAGGTITTFAPNDPHCPRCGRDYAFEWENDNRAEKLSICVPCLMHALDRAGIPRNSYTIEDRLTER